MNTVPLLLTPATEPVQAYTLSQQFELPLVQQLPATSAFYLQLTADGLGLCQQGSRLQPVRVDFVGGRLGFRRKHGGGRQQPLARAVGVKPGQLPTIIDATAGLGHDAFVLACLGCTVQMIERSPVVAALLSDGLQRAAQAADLQTVIDQLTLHYGNAHQLLPQLLHTHPAATVYLDPMYPTRRKSALVKKEMRLFRDLLGEDLDAIDLIALALTAGSRRVVVKRPIQAETLTQQVPHSQIHSEKTRYDIYLNH